MNFLLHYRTTGPTGRELAKSLHCRYGSRLTPKLRRELSQITNLIRWGNAGEFPISVVREINSRKAILNASNKLRALKLMKEAGISVPAFSIDHNELNYPVLGRNFSGFGGKDIVVYEEKGNHHYYGKSHDFYTTYIPNTREYRIHIVNGRIIRIQGKYLDHPDQHKNKYVKNYDQGFRFRTPDTELHSRRKEESIAAVEALGLDFGAVDLIIGTDKNHYILEVNTAPSCSPLTLSQYAEAIGAILRA